MAKCTYFFDKITNQIIGSHVHAERDPNGSIVSADSDISTVWESIRQGTMWPHLLEKVTGQNPVNMDYLVAEEIPTGYNEYKPSKLDSTDQLERRPYFCLRIIPQDRLLNHEEQERCSMHEVNTEGGVTLDMQVCVKTTQETCVNHANDEDVQGINCEILVECNFGRLIPRDGRVQMQNSHANFQWYLPDDTSKETARCYVKNSTGEVLISKSLQVRCC
ncbi:MAG: hypothetical protein HY540_00375 [Deltaproteobacteria bacterium]|nr:hypothetical protein [Deltaproteobacteria bacterium]